MKCPFCDEPESKVIDSRSTQDGKDIRRRRECLACARRFTTHEHIESVMPTVVKKDGRREPFNAQKIIRGVQTACQKRPVPISFIEELAKDVELALQNLGEKEIDSTVIGEEVMKRLHEIDQVAYVRFASVYRSFKDVNAFMSELSELLKQKK